VTKGRKYDVYVSSVSMGRRNYYSRGVMTPSGIEKQVVMVDGATFMVKVRPMHDHYSLKLVGHLYADPRNTSLTG